jgi:DNA-binding transcriptional LysR family regulator
MELNQIRFFLALAETLNFTRAAEICGVSQPSLSRAVRALEAELGGELVRRERGRSHLTELGRMVLPRLRQAVSLTDVAKAEANDFSRMSTATLTLGVMCTIGPDRLIALVDHLTRRLPQLELRLRDAPGERIVEMLLDGQLDVALVGLPEYPDALQAHALYDEPYVVAFPPGHRFERMEAVPWSELGGERYLDRLNCEFTAYFERVEGAFDLELDVRYASEHEDWIQAMIVAGLGCACMPRYMPLYPAIKTRPLVAPSLARVVSLVSVRGRRHAPAVDLFCRLAQTMRWQEPANG